MPTTVTKVIGTGGDYSTITLWEADLPADLVAGDTLQVGECKNETFTEAVTISGQTTDATRYVHLKCQAGASFMDNAGVRTNALRYNTANGMAITGNVPLTLTSNFTRVTGIQVTNPNYGNGISVSNGTTNCLVDSCIAKPGATGTNERGIHLGNQSGLGGTANMAVNCLVEDSGNNFGYGGRGVCYGCTAVSTLAGNTRWGFEAAYSEMLVKNCAVFGFSGFSQLATAAGSDYNATDNASASTGTHNVTSLTFADQFENSTNDFRAKSTGGLHAGTPDSNMLDDISGLTRSLTTPWIGAWEVAAAGAVAPPKIAVTAGNQVLSVSGQVMGV